MLNRLILKFAPYNTKIQYLRKQGMTIGAGCEILNGFEFGSEPYLITLGNNVRIVSGVRFITHDGGVWVLRHLSQELNDIDLFGPITVGDNCHIGTNVIVMPNVTIGNNCIIGCGAVVTRDIPDNSIAVGIPARVIKTIGDYEKQHMRDFVHTKNLSWDEKKKFIQSNM